MIRIVAAIAALLLLTAATEPPKLERRGRSTQLIVDGKPFLMLGGELSNSAASSAAHMAPVWPELRAAHLNTVLTPVSWQLIEPKEGQFDFSSVDALLFGARQSPASRAALVRRVEEQHVELRPVMGAARSGAFPARPASRRQGRGDFVGLFA
jgi:hypothetical protein